MSEKKKPVEVVEECLTHYDVVGHVMTEAMNGPDYEQREEQVPPKNLAVEVMLALDEAGFKIVRKNDGLSAVARSGQINSPSTPPGFPPGVSGMLAGNSMKSAIVAVYEAEKEVAKKTSMGSRKW